MVRNLRKAFTLIELMVVIVIIGVLASLAIPRFTEASLKAKVAEAPGVLKGFESAYLAAVAERGVGQINQDDLIYKAPDASKWFSYSPVSEASGGTCIATASSALKSSLSGKTLSASYSAEMPGGGDGFTHTGASELTKLVPNFLR